MQPPQQPHLGNYGLEIKTYNEHEVKKVHLGRREFLMAKNGTHYKILVHNRSDYCCDVSISISQQYIGTWRVNAISTLTITEDLRTKKEFCFDNISHRHVNAGLPAADACHESSIAVKFVPSNGIINSLAIPGQTVERLRGNQVDHRNIVTITLPIMICDHHV
jgi:hypothetical protein